MRVVFFGTSEFAVPTLQRLVAAGHSITAVVTQPARPKGRGRRLESSPVAKVAVALGLRVLDPAEPNAPGFVAGCTELEAELGVLAAYGCILSQALLDTPKQGFINLHPSLLPAYRGAAPIQRALMDGCTETGVSVIRMSRKVDAGALLGQESERVSPDDTAGELTVRLAESGAGLVIRTIERLERNAIRPSPQDVRFATSAPKIEDRERYIDWLKPAVDLHNLVRALSPRPAACTFFRSRRLMVLRSRPSDLAVMASPGMLVLDSPGLAAATGRGMLCLLEVKPESGGMQSGESFRNGHRPATGERFENRMQ